MPLTEGQATAIAQLQDIADGSQGDLSIDEITEPDDDHPACSVRLSFSTNHLEKSDAGLRVAVRELILLKIDRKYPLVPPRAYFGHKRFAGTAHVQWGNYICLYLAPDVEWHPADGMYGLVSRLNDWLKAAAKGELDPDHAPLHPPAVYASSQVKIVPQIDAPVLAVGEPFWIGAAILEEKNEYRQDIVGWVSLDDDWPMDKLLAPTVLLNQPLSFEYPEKVSTLILRIHELGLPISLLLKLLRLATLTTQAGKPLRAVVGAPMRRIAEGAPLRQHLAVWEIAPDAVTTLRDWLPDYEGNDDERWNAVLDWAVEASTNWCRVLENRPEVTVRRDDTSPAAWLRGKRILLLGCGAIGSFAGEFVVRSGTQKLTLIDNGIVSPGVLVRQLYRDDHVGMSKSRALKIRLDHLGLNTEIEYKFYDLQFGIFEHFNPEDYDLIIDATASRSVAFVLEQELMATEYCPPIVSMAFSGRAQHGMLVVRQPGYVAGMVDLDRCVKLYISRAYGGIHFYKAFWPNPGEQQMLQPEPGCSEPTFVGSSIDVAFLTSGMLSLAIERLQSLDQTRASVDFITRHSTTSLAQQPDHVGTELVSSTTMSDNQHNYTVRMSPGAEREMHAVIRSSAKLRGAKVETGGLIFGAVDDALQTIWIDDLTQPLPDSEFREDLFLCGTKGSAELSRAKKKSSAGSTSFIGIWHTHPVSQPNPSAQDMTAVAELLYLQERPPRHILILIVGFAATKPKVSAYLFRRGEFVKILEEQGLAVQGEAGHGG